jgi:hypothetical protein
MALTREFYLEIPASKWSDFLELEAKFFTKIKEHFNGRFVRWADTDNPLQNTVTGNYAYPFPVQFTKAKMQNFADRLDLSEAKRTYLKNNIKRLDMEDPTWFPEILDDD